MLYWIVFWTLNGLDKFLYGRKIVAFKWQGKDRTEQFGGYFEKVEIDASLIEPLLLFVGVWEIALGVAFAGALYRLVRVSSVVPVLRAMSLCITASILTFVAFSAFDIVAGDRAELLEHGVYMMLLLVSWVAVGITLRAHVEAQAGGV